MKKNWNVNDSLVFNCRRHYMISTMAYFSAQQIKFAQSIFFVCGCISLVLYDHARVFWLEAIEGYNLIKLYFATLFCCYAKCEIDLKTKTLKIIYGILYISVLEIKLKCNFFAWYQGSLRGFFYLKKKKSNIHFK